MALLQAGWTFTGYDASAHAAEETKDAARNAPRGILTSVVASALVGWVMLLAITLAVKDLDAATAAANPFIWVLERSLGGLGTALGRVAVGAMWFCGLSSVTSNSRMLYAFARDGGPPFSAWLSARRPASRARTSRCGFRAAAAFALSLWASVYSVMAALSTVALYASYAVPVACGLWARRRGWPRQGPWTLGRFGPVITVVAVAWVCLHAGVVVAAAERSRWLHLRGHRPGAAGRLVRRRAPHVQGAAPLTSMVGRR